MTHDLTCDVCSLEPPYEGFDQCLKCAVASEIHEGYDHLPGWRKRHAGTEWLARVEKEFERQLGAIAALSREVA